MAESLRQRSPGSGGLWHEVRASYAFVERNVFLVRRYWGWDIAFLI